MFIIEALGFVLLFVIIIALGAFTAASVVLSYIYWIVVAAFSVTAIAALCSRLVRFFQKESSSFVNRCCRNRILIGASGRFPEALFVSFFLSPGVAIFVKN